MNNKKDLIPQISLGQVQFEETILAEHQALLKQAWKARFEGFDNCDLGFYLQHQNHDTIYKTNNLTLNGRMFRIMAGIIFFIRRIFFFFGVRITSDLLAAHISNVEGSDLYKTQGNLIINWNKKVFRQSLLQVWIKLEGDKVTFIKSVDDKIKKSNWKYKLIQTGQTIHYVLKQNNEKMKSNFLLTSAIIFAVLYALMKISFTFFLWFEPVWFMEHIFPGPYPKEEFGSLLPARWIANRNFPLGIVILALVIKKEYRLLGILLIMGGILELMDGGVMMLSLIKGIAVKMTTISMVVGYLLFILGIYFGIFLLKFKEGK